MSEIKFRVWCYADDKYQMAYLNNGELDNGYWFSCPASIVHIDEYLSLMQYTNLKDKNGKDIYEADVVRCKQFDPFNEKQVVADHTGPVIQMFGCWIMGRENEYESGCISKFDEVEVLGNIYEHPHLLK